MGIRRLFSSIILGVVLASTTSVHAQDSEDKLHIYGFTQVLFVSKYTNVDVFKNDVDIPFDYSRHYVSNSFSLHQVNLFFQKAVSERSTFFLNLEASGSYSSRIPSGYLEIPEGWISYRLNDELELKAGLLLPKFNNLLEIKNRLPLFPYLIRPIFYENLISETYDPEDYRPDRAYVLINYITPISRELVFDAAFYMGNSEDSFLATTDKSVLEEADTEERARIYLGENMNSALLFGGRIGIENVFGTFKFGISGTIDEDNKKISETSVYSLPSSVTPIMGEVPRYRLGLDLSFNLEKFAFESEFMGAYHNHSKIHEIPQFKNVNLNKFFQYSNLTYNFTTETYIYGGYSYSRDLTYEFLIPNTPSPDGAGLHVINFGAGWRPIENTILKAQYFQGVSGKNPNLQYSVTFLSLGISTIF